MTPTTGRRGLAGHLPVLCAFSLALVLIVAPGVLGGIPASAAVEQGTPWTWGANGFGQLGDGTTQPRLTPQSVPGLSGVVELHGGREHVIALHASGRVYTWGDNSQGQLGIGSVGGIRTSPVEVPGLSDVVAVTTGHYHSLALRSDGSVWSWGFNAFGQLGDGTSTRRPSPVRVAGTHVFSSIAAGRDMSYAIRADGTLWGWGLNSEGQLGDGTTVSRATPVRVGQLNGVVAVAGGRDHGLAVLQGGALWGWGWNQFGQVGDGTTSNRLSPVPVTTGVSDVIAGAHHSYALKSDGTVWSWGRNYRAALGDGTTVSRSSPVRVVGVAGATAIATGRDHGLAVVGGRVMAWGYNVYGQLGDGTTTSRPTAIEVPGLQGATLVGGGAEYSVALVSEGGPVNQDPVAVVGVPQCSSLTCTFSGAGSHDPDGVIIGYTWDFGDGQQGDGVEVVHSYVAAGTYTARLTVVDDAGATGSATVTVTVTSSGSPGVGFRAVSATNTNAQAPTVTIPASVQPGDQLVLFVTANRDAAMTPPAGWTVLGTRLDGTDLRSWALTRMATAASAGSTVTVALDARTKTDLTVLAYSSAAPVATALSANQTGTSANHVAPAVTVPVAGSWVVNYWADKTQNNTGWTLPSGSVHRASSVGEGSGRIVSVVGDTGPVAAGPRPAVTATSNVASAKAIAWTIVVAPP